jgi:uncharacterized protein YicC (UPF0701 family)
LNSPSGKYCLKSWAGDRWTAPSASNRTGNAKPVSINTDLAKAYYRALADLSGELQLDPSNILSTLVKLPEVITPTSDTLTDEEWEQFEKVILAAIEDLNAHRLNEGASLEETCSSASTISSVTRKK